MPLQVYQQLHYLPYTFVQTLHGQTEIPKININQNISKKPRDTSHSFTHIDNISGVTLDIHPSVSQQLFPRQPTIVLDHL